MLSGLASLWASIIRYVFLDVLHPIRLLKMTWSGLVTLFTFSYKHPTKALALAGTLLALKILRSM